MRNLKVGRHDREAVSDGLRDEHSIKRIAVQQGQPRDDERGVFVERQCLDAAEATLGGNQPFGRFRQRQLSGFVFRRDLPYRHRAQKHLVRRVADERFGMWRERSSAREPQEGAGVEQELHNRRFVVHHRLAREGSDSATRDARADGFGSGHGMLNGSVA